MRIGDLMAISGVTFGTSGARGLAADMTDQVCYLYTSGFLAYLRARGLLGTTVGLAGDLRPSTPRILTACARAIRDAGCRPRYFGAIPTPALAAYGIAHSMPTLMVTGSHIPAERNGIKFYLPSGEILKEDEAGIAAQDLDPPAALFTAHGTFAADPGALPDAEDAAFTAYVRRFLDFFPPDALAGWHLGLYEHSSVACAAATAVLTGLGATVVPFGRAPSFVPVDTEAIRPEDIQLARDQAARGRFDALVSTDGDGDRPLLADATGQWLRGDLAGVLCARALGAQGVVTPISSNTAVERCGWFDTVLRTRIGSPYVIAGMNQLRARGLAPVMGYEANGGFLLASDLLHDGRRLTALPTRDALIVPVTLLATARAQGQSLAALSAALPRRFTHSDRLQDFPSARAQSLLATLTSDDPARDRAAAEARFGALGGAVATVERTDGVRVLFASGEILHLRPSGNAPELRVYTEADSLERAQALNAAALEQARAW